MSVNLDFLFHPRAVSDVGVDADIGAPLHPDAQALSAYWAAKRDGAGLVAWAAIKPAEIVRLLPSLFLLAPVEGGWRFRLVGTELCGRFGEDLTGRTIHDLFTPATAALLMDFYAAVLSEGRPRALRGRYVHPNIRCEAAAEGVHLPVVGRDRPTLWVLGGVFFEDSGTGAQCTPRGGLSRVLGPQRAAGADLG